MSLQYLLVHHELIIFRAAFCQIFDSIFSESPRIYVVRELIRVVDIPMARVKFNVNTEYAYLQNFKILQSVFSLFLYLLL